MIEMLSASCADFFSIGQMMWHTFLFLFSKATSKTAFKIVDADGSGSIDFHELKANWVNANFPLENQNRNYSHICVAV